ncbi:MAG: hypothetical protein D6806_10905 [Deltaproteobacteria bacterium]|nr:MAG: hypothetical protein D6806_10905 [Deltaproteobacteria bacterium]
MKITAGLMVALFAFAVSAAGTASGEEAPRGVGKVSPAALDEAEKLLAESRYSEAVKLLGDLRAKGATDARHRKLMGKAYLGLGMHQEALIEFSEILKTNPNDYDANLGRARALLGLGDARKAEGRARLCTELRPDAAEAHLVLGQILMHPTVAKHAEAEKACRRALELSGESREGVVCLSKALNYQKKTDRAVGILRGWLERHPDDVQLRVKLAESLYALRRLGPAEREALEALKRQPDSAYAKRVLGQIRSRKAYQFWVPVVAIVAFPLFYFLIRRMRRGKELKAEDV